MESKFEDLLSGCRGAVERFVYFKLPLKYDADDVLQDVYLTAYRKFGTLKDTGSFKAWIIRIARNKCSDYFRRKAGEMTIPLESLTENVLTQGRYGLTESSAVRDTLELLGDRDKQILYLYFFRCLPQTEIAERLGVPLGTVKSRLHSAKHNFRDRYPYPPQPMKGVYPMKKLPERMPAYLITESGQPPFDVKWEELMGWFLIPKPGEELSWGMYDIPSRECSHVYDMQVTGKAEVHGIEGVELTARESDYSRKKEAINRTFVAQLTDTHCRYLAAMRTENGVRKYITFLDDAFLPNWGFGENNCGNATDLRAKGDIVRDGSRVRSAERPFLLDIVGRYTVAINGKNFDTVCVMDLETCRTGVISEQYLDRNGRTVLWRRFNRDDWAIDRYKKKWSEQLPQNDRLTVNGRLYVEWYDCITDYIL